jgi:ribosomal protein L28
MKIKTDFNQMDANNLKIGAKENSYNIQHEVDEFISKLRSREGQVIHSLDEIELDDEGLMISHGERIVLYIRDTGLPVEELIDNPKGDNVRKYHIHGNCQTLKRMEKSGHYDRYNIKSKPDGKFIVDGVEGGRKINNYRVIGGRTVEVEEPVELAICANCLKELGIYHEKSLHEWRNSFDIKEFFSSKKAIPKPKKSKYYDYNFPKPEKKYDKEFKYKSKKLKKELNYCCQECGVDLSTSLYTRSLLHCHHINGVDRNHKYSNLEILCLDCHIKKGREKNISTIEDRQTCREIKLSQEIKID